MSSSDQAPEAVLELPELPELPEHAAPPSARDRLRHRVVAASAAVTVAAAGFAVLAINQPAVWFLPADQVADPAATTVTILVDEVGCTSGRGAAGRMLPPTVRVTDTSVVIGVRTRVRFGGGSCPAHPLAPLVVDLGQPLGNRDLVDAHGSLDDDYRPAGSRFDGVQVPPAASSTSPPR